MGVDGFTVVVGKGKAEDTGVPAEEQTETQVFTLLHYHHSQIDQRPQCCDTSTAET